jgi:hypothetical protein
MHWVPLAISGLALIFTLGSFWWLNARRGRLRAARPRSFAYLATSEQLRLRLPLSLYNTGAEALLVEDLRVVDDEQPTTSTLRWITTRDRLRPEKEDGFAFATPFAVAGRSAREIIAEFGGDKIEWDPPAASMHRLRLEAMLHPRDDWVEVVSFDWWAPVQEGISQYVTHRNEPRSKEHA